MKQKEVIEISDDTSEEEPVVSNPYEFYGIDFTEEESSRYFENIRNYRLILEKTNIK
ncbi:28386_t:CDS:2 [Dentiscutata erythropus]|uniref:28386_t:CDS:1 n=1 Tax=Dentiscutata erythropus TaxID=1348616 RepID=A0A9N9ADW7_9GLOM|nr:28386_t:CDS:2 [Dentiscutata erythropus]